MSCLVNKWKSGNIHLKERYNQGLPRRRAMVAEAEKALEKATVRLQVAERR
jgi:hypothetical protein